MTRTSLGKITTPVFLSLAVVSAFLLTGVNSLGAVPAIEDEVLDTRPNEPPYTNTEEADLSVAKKKEPEGNKISHPNATKGLYLIDRTTGNYYYKVDKTTKKEATMSIRVGTYEEPTLSSSTPAGDIQFSDVYQESAPIFLMYDYAWSPFQKFRNLALQMGVGFLITQGNGVLMPDAAAPTTVREAKERYTFIAVPLSLGAVFRLEFWPNQWIVPYAAGGGTYFGLIETRDDGKETKIVGSPAAYGAGGFLLNLSSFDKQTAFIFDREYGINNIWLAGEFRIYQSLSDDLDMSSNVINFGITVDY